MVAAVAMLNSNNHNPINTMFSVPRYFALASACVCSLLAGCNSSNSESNRIVGDWQIVEVEEVADRVGEASGGEQDEAQPAPNPSNMVVQFQSSGRLATETAIGNINSVKNGTWKFLSYSEASNTMQIECNLAGQITEHEIEFMSADLILWVPPNMAGTSNRMQFRRK